MNHLFTGTLAWMVQRIAAVYLTGFSIYMVGFVLLSPPTGYAEWREWVASLPVSVLTTLFFVSLLAHSWVGMRDILMDYIPGAGLRLVAIALVGFALVAQGLWAARILLGVAL